MKPKFSDLPEGYGTKPKEQSWMDKQLAGFVDLSIPACACFLLVWAVQAIHPVPAYYYGLFAGFFFVGNVVLRTTKDVSEAMRGRRN